MYVTRVIFIFWRDQGSCLLPIHHTSKGMCQDNVLHTWKNVTQRVGLLLVLIMYQVQSKSDAEIYIRLLDKKRKPEISVTSFGTDLIPHTHAHTPPQLLFYINLRPI